MIGTKLAHYEITSHLGSGGMGDVYQATDAKLGRSVAVKFLPDAFVSDADRVARFEREARLLALLNHPNIAAIYGLEEANEKKFLVMELIGGETLAERIRRGPIPLEEALVIANQIARALEAAHEQGIVHRDLKPANIKITADDKVKVLDFGLAKASQQESGSAIFSHSPTMVSVGGTNAGMILGTAAYMAPEQARGKKVDQRADIWAFGVVFYEMLTGQSLFKGEDLTEILASVVKDKPDLSIAPRRVRRLLEACLEKDPGKRLQAIGDMRLLIEADAPSEALPPAASTPSRIGKFAWLVAAVGTILAAVAFWAPWRKLPEPPDMVRFQIEAPPKTIFTNWMALSPDGKKVAFTARVEDGVRLWIRPIDSLEAKPIATTSTNPVPFWSPDSRWIAYQVEGKLRKVEAAGGPSQALSEAPVSFGGGAFTPDGSTIVFGSTADGLKKVSSSGGMPVAITKLDSTRQETGHYMPVFLADGKHFFYHRQSSNPDNSGTFIGSLDDKPDAPAPARLLAESFNPIYAPASDGHSGYVLFRRERALMAQRFDESKLALSGDPVLVADSVGNMSASFLNAGVSPRTLIVRETGIADVRQLVWIDRNGVKEQVPLTDPANWGGVVLSLDGTQAAVHRADNQSNFDVYTIDLARRLPTRLTFDRALDAQPIWSPDRSRIVFFSDREGGRNLFWKAANGTTQEELLYKSSNQNVPEDWSRDGKYILFTSITSKSGGDIWMLSMAQPEHKATPFLGTNGDEQQARFSPDGHYVIYRSDEGGTQQIYMRSFPDTGGKWQISKDGGANPRWSHDGKEIYFTSGGANMMAVKISTAPTVQLSDPVKLFTGFDGGSYDVGPDGRFLMAVTTGQNSVNPITVTLNWQDALKK